MPRILIALGLGGLLAGALAAQDTAELLTRMRAMEERLQQMEAQLKALQGQPAPAAVPPAVTAEAPPQPLAEVPQAVNVAQVLGNKIFNPEMAAIGTLRGAAGYDASQFSRDPVPALEMQEAELSLQAVVDPYARADVFLSFGEQGVDIEEAYLTFTSLPGAVQLRAGKMRSAFGKVNTMHLHMLPWIDRPLMVQNVIGGEEALATPASRFPAAFPPPARSSSKPPARSTGATRRTCSARTGAPTSAQSITCAPTGTSPRPRTSISASPTRGATAPSPRAW